jgi:hypothetical protein
MVWGVLLLGVVGVAGVVTAPWVEENVSDISRPVHTPSIAQEQGDAGKQRDIPVRAAKTGQSRLDDGEQWIDVF